MPTLASKLIQNMKQTRLGKILVSLFVFLVLLSVLSVWLLPAYLKTILPEQIQNETGRKFTVEHIAFSPWRLALRLENGVLYEADQKQAAFSFKELRLNLSSSSLWHRALVVDEVALVEPTLNVTRISADGVGRYNFSDILDKFAAKPASKDSSRFSIENIQLHQGRLQFNDAVFAKKTDMSEIEIALPFVSNFPKEVDSFIQPLLSANVNGSHFGIQARVKPFADSLDTSLAIDVSDLDLVKFVDYVPFRLPVQLQQLQLSTKLDLHFNRENKQAKVLLSGDLKLHHIALKDLNGQPLVNAASISTHLRKVDILNSEFALDTLQIDSPEVWLAVDQTGKWNFAASDASKSTSSSEKIKTSDATAEKSTSDKALPNFRLKKLALNKGSLHFADAQHAKPSTNLDLSVLQVDVSDLDLAQQAKPAKFRLQFETAEKAGLNLQGEFQVAKKNFDAKLDVHSFELASIQAFLNPSMNARVAGQVALQSKVSIAEGIWKLSDLDLQFDELHLQTSQKEDGDIQLHGLKLNHAQIDSSSNQVDVQSLELVGLNARLVRDQAEKLIFDKLLKVTSSPKSAAATATATATASNPSTKPQSWHANVEKILINDSRVQFDDQSLYPYVSIAIDEINTSVDGLSSDFSRSAQWKWRSSFNRKGKLNLQANIGPQLKKIDVDLDTQAFPLAAFYPYFARQLNVSLNRGNVSSKAKIALQEILSGKPQIQFDGDVRLQNFHMLESGSTEDFLEWKNIALEGISAKLGIAQPSIDLKKLVLQDFFARAILSEKGVLNLQNIIVDTQKVKNAEVPTSSNVKNDAGEKTAEVASVAESEVNANDVKKTTTPALAIRIAQTEIRGGNVNFTDHFIKPNYSANLTGVLGRIGAIASDNPQAATVELTGKIDNDAPLVISGTINPLATPLFLDIKGSASGIELTRLTPYAAKYAGYSIQKGKLSVQVQYQIAQQQLSAQNSVRLDQLTFGDRIDSPDATHLPVMLAVALLSDNDGNIAIDLPISGSVSDPEFSVGGIIVKVFVNLISKAATAPFALLTHAFGGSSDDLSFVEFAAGSADLTPAMQKRLDELNEVLKKRNAVKLDLTARVEPVSDTEALRRVQLDEKILALKKRELAKTKVLNKSDVIQIEVTERNKYLEQVYHAADMQKPRNFVGMEKSLPASEMEALLLRQANLRKDALLQLANRRADAVKNYLEEKGLEKQRLFLIAPKLEPQEGDAQLPIQRVDLSLK